MRGDGNEAHAPRGLRQAPLTGGVVADSDEADKKEQAEKDRFDKRWGSGKPKGPEPQGGKDPRKGQ